jgi:hypothetical protein
MSKEFTPITPSREPMNDELMIFDRYKKKIAILNLGERGLLSGIL